MDDSRHGQDNTNRKPAAGEDTAVQITNPLSRRAHVWSLNCLSDAILSTSAAAKKQTKVTKLLRRASSDLAALASPASPSDSVHERLTATSPAVGQERYLKEVLNDVLGDGTPGVIALRGVGGVGKTTLLRSVNDVTAGRSWFDHVIFLVVTRTTDLIKVQTDIANAVGLLLKDDEGEPSRAAAIFSFLQEKSFLLLLDDLQGPLDLGKVGIPRPRRLSAALRRQKVILATRSLEVCEQMRAHKVIKLESLGWEDAWNLFKAKVGEGIINGDAAIRGLAETLARECGGLPLALTVVGLAMSGKKTPEEWQHTIDRFLERSRALQVSATEDKLFFLLRISYDNLRDDRTRECFLSCSLWPEDFYLTKDNLVKLWIGLGLLDESGDIEETYDTADCMLESLKAACLLETSSSAVRFFRMHRVIRDMASWITDRDKGEKSKWLVRANASQITADEWRGAPRISLMYGATEELPDDSGDSSVNLQSLMLQGNKLLCEIPGGLFRSMPALRQLDLSYTSIRALPPEVGDLVNLLYLNLSYTRISSLPRELQNLENLAYLDLEGTRELKEIPQGVISGLVMLQLLNLYKSLVANWNRRSESGLGGVAFEELELLPRLSWIGLTVRHAAALRWLFDLPNVFVHSLSVKKLQGSVTLDLSPAIVSAHKAGRLRNLSLANSNIRRLVVGDGESSSSTTTQVWSLASLQYLFLGDLPMLEEVVWRGLPPQSCLPRLRWLAFYGCHGLENVAWASQLPSLEELYIDNCGLMDRVIGDDESPSSASRSAATTAAFPRLKVLYLRDLENLVSISDYTLKFPSLEQIVVCNCKGLKKLPLGWQSAEKIRAVYGEKKWWESLEWGDYNLKSFFLPYFRKLPAGFSARMVPVHKLL